MRTRNTVLAAAILLLPALAACDRTPFVPAQPATITLAAADLRLTVGDVAGLAAQVLDQQGRLMPGVALAYSSDNPGIATVDAGGMVRAVSPGSASITASHGSVKAAAQVTVARDERGLVQLLDVLADSMSFDVRAGTQAVALQAFNGYGQPLCPLGVTVRSSDPSVVTASLPALCLIHITPLFRGTATVVVQADGARDSVRVNVTRDSAYVIVSARPPADSLYAGNTVTYAFRMMDAEGTPLPNRTVRFAVSGGSLAASHAATDASGTARVSWTLPTKVDTVGKKHFLYARTLLSGGAVASWSETVNVGPAKLVWIQLYRLNAAASEWNPFNELTITVPVGANVHLGARGRDRYGNMQADGIAFTVEGPLQFVCNTGRSGELMTTCVRGWRAGIGIVRARHAASGAQNGVQIVVN